MAADGSALFQFVSDVHLEFNDYRQVDRLLDRIVRKAPTLVLAGDIGNPSHPSYQKLLDRVSGMFERVFIIAGNHEFYGSSISETKAELRRLVAPLPNVYFLDDETFVSDLLPVHIFGGTMWSSVTESERAEVERVMSDGRRIYGFGVSDARNHHHVFVDLLEAALESHTDKPFLVVSHHLPAMHLIDPEYKGSGINSAFATDVRVAEDNGVVAWIYGHTHKPCLGAPGKWPATPHEQRFFCNPIGYPGENHEADPNRVLEIVTDRGTLSARLVA